MCGSPIFWVAAFAGIIVFGSLMGAMFIGQQYLQNVLGHHTLDAGFSMLPAALALIIVAPRSAKLVESKGSRLHLRRSATRSAGSASARCCSGPRA